MTEQLALDLVGKAGDTAEPPEALYVYPPDHYPGYHWLNSNKLFATPFAGRWRIKAYWPPDPFRKWEGRQIVMEFVDQSSVKRQGHCFVTGEDWLRFWVRVR